MAVKLRRPILVGGIGISLALWMWESLHQSVGDMGEFGLVGAIAVGAWLWLFQRRTPKNPLQLSGPIDRETAEKEIAIADTVITQLESEAENHQAIAQLRQQVSQLTVELDRKEMQVAVTGGKAVGKTTLMQVLPSSGENPNLGWKETPALFTSVEKDETTAWEIAIASDLVLFITNGDLTATEFQTLKQLEAAKHNTVLVFNKQDRYLPEARLSILQQLQQRMQPIVGLENIVAIAAAPNPIKVRQHQSDGSLQEWMEQPQPDLGLLSNRLNQIITQQSQQLVWATTWRKAGLLKTEVRGVLNQVRCDRAMPTIEQYQWIAAAAAFANPVPALDLLATAAINAQMVIDLGAMYKQKFSLEQAQISAGTLGSLMLKLGLVELSTQTIGGILKSNAITYVAGGLIQGVSAAYLTRVAGLSLIEYFQEQDPVATEPRPLNFDQIGQTLQKVFQQNQRVAFLQSFVKQAVGRLLPESSQSEIVVNNPL